MAATSRSTEALTSFALHKGGAAAPPVAEVVASGSRRLDSPLSLQPTAVNNANVITVIALSGQRLRLLLPIAPQIDLIEGEMQASPVRILSAAELLHTAGHGSHAREPLTAYGQKLLAIDNRLTLNRPGYRLRYSRSLEGSRDASKEGFHS